MKTSLKLAALAAAVFVAAPLTASAEEYTHDHVVVTTPATPVVVGQPVVNTYPTVVAQPVVAQPVVGVIGQPVVVEHHYHKVNEGYLHNGRTVPHMVTGSRKDSTTNVRWAGAELGGVHSSRTVHYDD